MVNLRPAGLHSAIQIKQRKIYRHSFGNGHVRTHLQLNSTRSISKNLAFVSLVLAYQNKASTSTIMVSELGVGCGKVTQHGSWIVFAKLHMCSASGANTFPHCSKKVFEK